MLRWAGDPEGGAPFVEADPSHPDPVVGFDVEVAALLAAGIGRTPEFLNVTFRSIDQSIARGDADIGLSGIEDTPARRATMAVTLPYYEFREVLSVRDADASRFRSLADLRGKTVGTLGGTIAYEILLRAEREHGLRVVSYEDDVHPYSDLVIGRVDAVLLDNVLAERRHKAMPRLHDSAADGRDRPLRRRPLGRRTRRSATASTRSCAARCATAGSSASSGRGRSGTTISRSCTSGCSPACRCRRSSASTRRPAWRR